MPYYDYILYSKSIDKYYVGKTENPEGRWRYHNSALNQIWTKRGKPWELENSTLSSKAERFIKKQKSRKFIQEIVELGWKG